MVLFFFRMTGRRAGAEDLAQETFVRVYLTIPVTPMPLSIPASLTSHQPYHPTLTINFDQLPGSNLLGPDQSSHHRRQSVFPGDDRSMTQRPASVAH